MSLIFGNSNIPCNIPSWSYHGFCWWCHFGKHIQAVAKEFENRYFEYGDSYLHRSIEWMLLRLNGEVQEISTTNNLDELYTEVKHVVNVGMMLLELIEKKRKNESE